MIRPNVFSIAQGGRPVLALDVDGVLIPDEQHLHMIKRETPVDFGYRYRGIYTDRTAGTPLDIRVWLHDAHGAFLRSVHGAGITIAWATSWGAAARELGVMLGLPAGLPVIDVAGRHRLGVYAGRSTKWQAVDSFAGERPLIWIDDELGRDDWPWAEERHRGRGLPTMLVRTHPAYGLTLGHALEVVDWINNELGLPVELQR